MMQKKMKTIAMYGLILVAGLGSGYALSLLPGLLKSNDTEGNYAAYFPNAQAKVVLYGTHWCGYCAKTRAYFKENKIEFVDLDIEKSPAAKKAHEELGGGGVPVVLIGNRKIQGFNTGALEAALKKI
ncbi:glutaredoxin family protein [Janthinobacterium sp. ROICE36]|uniref:glutaredoxin family protein n=1 Tax=Janthinobacterium sp. ROICE36 TaxID=2048670 RepID=UPI002155D077|nr:glutaredoxin family protein [Janthinobacterium sp. ROICE36]